MFKAVRGPRLAFTASYFMDGALVMPPKELEDSPSYAEWLSELDYGAPAEHPLLPLLPEPQRYSILRA